MQMKTPIMYWKGILGDKALLNEYKTTIGKLRNKQYKAAGLEKLQNYRILSVRASLEKRLLLVEMLVNGELHLVLLDEVLNHDYKKSRFFKAGVLDDYIE